MKRIGRISAVLLALTLAGCSRIIEDVPDVRDNSPDSPLVTLDSSRYIYSQLSEKEQQWYDIIADAARSHSEAAELPEKAEPDELRKLFMAVYYEEEDLFWLASYYENPPRPTDTLHLYYRFEDEDLDAMQAELDSRADEILSSFDEDTTDYEKLLRIHDEIVLGATFEDDENYARTIYGALCKGISQCVGYAKAFDYLCKKADIDCMTVMGTNEKGLPHSWNIVLLDGSWYHVDCTWDDPILSPVDTEFLRHYYFLVTDSDIIGVTHSLDTQYFYYPECTAADNYYVREGLICRRATEAQGMFKSLAVKQIGAGHKDIALRFENENAFSLAQTLLFDTGGMKDVLVYVNNNCDKKVRTDRYIRYINSDELIIHVSMIYDN